MSMPVRSRKELRFGPSTTPAAVGPGKYNASSRSIVPSYAAFASTSARDLNASNSTSALTPGPGTYGRDALADASIMSMSQSSLNASMFRSKVSRIGPIAKGSTPFQESTASATPGPGAYDVSSMRPSSSAPALGYRRKAPVVQPERAPPTIPRPDQCFGYEPAGHGKWVPQGPPNETYTGVRNDTVGPAFYNPTLPRKASKVLDFSRSRTQRSSTAPNRSYSAPPRDDDAADSGVAAKRSLRGGQLTTVASMMSSASAASSSPPGSRKAGKPRRKPSQSAVFKSKVPMSHDIPVPEDDTPGPGTYQQNGLNLRKQAPTAFGSTVNRVGWERNPNMPYTDPECITTPGPGSYHKTQRHSALAAAQAAAVAAVAAAAGQAGGAAGFNSTDERYCCKALSKSDAPGPGSYKSNARVGSASHARRSKGMFGSVVTRFGNEDPAAAPSSHEGTPGPGYYTVPKQQQTWGRKLPSATFRSSSNRFIDPRSNELHLIGEQTAPAVTKYNVHKSWVKPRTAGKNTAQFASKVRRFGFQTAPTPGPGSYEPEKSSTVQLEGGSMAAASMGSVGFAVSSYGSAGGAAGFRGSRALQRPSSTFGSRQVRFHKGADSFLHAPKAGNTGPGSYNVGGGFVRRSYNVTMR